MHEILTPREMGWADRFAAQTGPFDSYGLMHNAGAEVTAEILARYPEAAGCDILCGPGNNGGDGYVVARMLHERGVNVRLWRQAEPRQGTDAGRAAAACPVEPRALETFEPEAGRVIVDALFGAGLSRSVEGGYAQALEKAGASKDPIVAVDLPSGISGESGAVLGIAAPCTLTITFFRKKPGHLLQPGRHFCGETVVSDIGIRAEVLTSARPTCFENTPALWSSSFPRPAADTHKYQRGHVAVFSGGPTTTGAARLAALGAARIGAGAVTLLSPSAALAVNAMHLTSIMLHRTEDQNDFSAFLRERHPAAIVLGPGFGVVEKVRVFAEMTLKPGGENKPAHLVLDADGITAYAAAPEQLTAAAENSTAKLVLTPHMGEFARLFPDLAADEQLSKLDKARQAAVRTKAIVVLKGSDTVIAAPDAHAAINANATPYLATAGSGDVLSGMIAGLLGQGMPAFEAACAAVFLHADAGGTVGPGLIAEDLPEKLPEAIRRCLGEP
ncbi:NAD(P)H-hydrate dehydratase [Chelativorans sp. YIM 93263]|uniref:NAD(P)H-hydrate dehydratase n=1 Tax=Chelativorans sp. YIM 93263 TaxID=2906648 RepID=UPI0023792FEC|nr:NAD(P)H-hydrate dehydratase [Chelativorans sp. YIM 93263]